MATLNSGKKYNGHGTTVKTTLTGEEWGKDRQIIGKLQRYSGII